jgi:hypothetical protein
MPRGKGRKEEKQLEIFLGEIVKNFTIGILLGDLCSFASLRAKIDCVDLSS